MKKYWDIIVVGAGPAGLACANSLAEQGLSTIVLDEQPVPGGQIYRNIGNQSEKTLHILGEEYRNGGLLIEKFHGSGVDYSPRSKVWKIEHNGKVCFSRDDFSQEIQAKRIVIATGAMERPVPFTGWTLPGVMGAGAVDAAFKSDGILPESPVAIAGSGPLALLVANHLTRLGVEVSCFFDTTPSKSISRGLRYLPAAIKRPGYLAKGIGMLVAVRRNVHRYVNHVSAYAALGQKKIERVDAEVDERQVSIPVSMLLVHEGIIPRTEFGRQLRLKHSWNPVQRYWYPDVDANGCTSSPVIYMTGDGTFIHGAIASTIKGELTALAIGDDLGCDISMHRERRTALEKMLSREVLPRPFVDAIYSPRNSYADIDDEVYVCRCEEVTAGMIRRLVKEGQTTPEMVKSLSRCGMGPCQGRMCSSSLSEMIAIETGNDVNDLLPLTVRPPVRNIGLGELANMSLLAKDSSIAGDEK